MSSAATSHNLGSRSHLPTFGNFGNTLLERGNPGIRRSTPDSEALASSDEEVEQSRLRTANQRRNLPNRRSSLLADQQAENRRSSLAGSNSYSPATGSQPNTPGIAQDAWSTISPGSGTWSSGSGYPFGSSIWGSRDPPSRLQEVSAGPDGRLPFAIPSQPNPSTYRSMSFSVGQTEATSHTSSPGDNRARPGGGVQRRSSKQGLFGNEGGNLSRLNEIDDDNGQVLSNEPEPPRSSHSARGQSQLLRNQMRTLSSSSNQLLSAGPPGPRMRTSPYETPELAIDDSEEPAQLRYPIRNAPTRRLSDIQSLQPARPSNSQPFSNASFANRRAGPHWSSELDFGQLEAIPQSRRHSFADVPTRRGSLGSNEDEHSISQDARSQGLSQDTEPSYYATDDEKRREAEQEVQRKLLRQQSQSLFGGNTPYGMPSHMGAYHGPSNIPLYIVNFKCSRTDVFYIQEGTGLEVEPGNLVIVEADRGTDLGTVQHANVSWEEARYFKAYYAEEHYKWLMMFSQQSRIGGPNASNPNPVNPRSAGQGPGHRDAHNDIKPKMIKRLAQPHEIQALQEKEGNEAKAKRVCQQRVAEHGLNMEILDAEFQMDSKKLTFYYFADTYINFNALVTDLFKIYKTRIWMSAINPASFMTPTSSLGLTPAFAGPSFGPPGAQFPMGSPQPYEDPRDQNRGFAQQRHPMSNPYYAGQGGFPTSMQAPIDPFSAYPTQAYGILQTRPATLGFNRQDSIPRSAHTGSQHDLSAQFGNMSLDRFRPNSSNQT